MKYELENQQKENLDKFKKIYTHLVGLPAILFAYSPGFQELEILIKQDSKYFLLKFMHTLSIKTCCEEWIFGGFEVEIQVEKQLQHNRIKYKFSDRNYLEVTCLFFGAIEIINSPEILDYQNWEIDI